MKKIIIFIFVFFLCINVEAKTVQDLKNELDKIESEYNENQSQKKLTQSQIEEIKNNITRVQSESAQIIVDISNLDKEIQSLNKKIAENDQTIKDIVNFYQIQQGEPDYLEYITGANDFSDFIYRAAISEQLSKYTDKKTEEFNKNIILNENKTNELRSKEKNLQAKKIYLQQENQKLLGVLSNIEEEGMSILEDIKAQRDLIKYYTDRGCKLSDNLETCILGQLPPGTMFYRPLMRGYVTSEYGLRNLNINGSYDHRGIDISIRPNNNVSVYSAAPGKVAVVKTLSCGGRSIFIHHEINGRKYTTVYMHMMNIYVSMGQVVTKDTVIGTMGGGSNTWGWDACSTGAHLHFAIAYGLYGVDQPGGIQNYYFNPRSMVNFPTSHSVTFVDRTTRYN